MEEMHQLQEKAGLKKKSNQLDWMYASAGQGASVMTEDKEAYLLGAKKIDKILAPTNELEGGFSLSNGAALDLSNANTLRDTQSKIREDPLLTIKKMEKASLDRFLNNPLKVNQIKEQKKKSKKERKAKKEKKSKRHSDESDYSSPRSPHREYRSRSGYYERSPDTRNYRRSRSPVKRRETRSRERYSRRSRSPARREPDSYRRYDRPSEHSRHQTAYESKSSSQVDNSKEKAEKERKLQEMMNDAQSMHSERSKMIQELNRQQEEEEANHRRAQARIHNDGHIAKFMSDARHSAYSSTHAVDLGSRIRSQRAKLSIDD